MRHYFFNTSYTGFDYLDTLADRTDMVSHSNIAAALGRCQWEDNSKAMFY